MTHSISLIQIGGKYALGSDEICVTLYKCRVVKKTGKVVYDPIGYFPNFEQAFHRLADIHVQGCQNSCKFDCITELKNFVTEAVKSLAQRPSLPDQGKTADQCRGGHAPEKAMALNGLKSKRHREHMEELSCFPTSSG